MKRSRGTGIDGGRADEVGPAPDLDPRPPRPRSPRPGRVRSISVGVVAVLGLALALLPYGPAAAESMAPSAFRFAVAVAHLPLVAAFLFFLFTEIGHSAAEGLPRSRVARAAWTQLVRGLALLSLSWLGLYTWMALAWGNAAPLGEWVRGPRGLAVADLLNTCGSLAFFYLYLVLDKPSVPDADDPDRDVDFRRALGTVAVVCAVVAGLSLLGRLGWLHLSELGPLLGSFVAAVAMMYLFGQFDYRYMKVRRALIAPLYLYVAIQVAWHEIADAGTVSWYPDLLLLGALLLKAYLFATLALWIRRRTLQRYLDFAAL